jgi:hypothetical protein
MPKCFCPEELGGARHFEHVSAKTDWSPTNEHFPLAQRDGGRETPDNSVLAHRLCNGLDFSITTGPSHRRDLERIRTAREAATSSRLATNVSSDVGEDQGIDAGLRDSFRDSGLY